MKYKVDCKSWGRNRAFIGGIVNAEVKVEALDEEEAVRKAKEELAKAGLQWISIGEVRRDLD